MLMLMRIKIISIISAKLEIKMFVLHGKTSHVRLRKLSKLQKEPYHIIKALKWGNTVSVNRNRTKDIFSLSRIRPCFVFKPKDNNKRKLRTMHY